MTPSHHFYTPTLCMGNKCSLYILDSWFVRHLLLSLSCIFNFIPFSNWKISIQWNKQTCYFGLPCAVLNWSINCSFSSIDFPVILKVFIVQRWFLNTETLSFNLSDKSPRYSHYPRGWRLVRRVRKETYLIICKLWLLCMLNKYSSNFSK